jgi:hypothetical protein
LPPTFPIFELSALSLELICLSALSYFSFHLPSFATPQHLPHAPCSLLLASLSDFRIHPSEFPMPYAPCSVPHAPCPMLYANLPSASLCFIPYSEIKSLHFMSMPFLLLMVNPNNENLIILTSSPLNHSKLSMIFGMPSDPVHRK